MKSTRWDKGKIFVISVLILFFLSSIGIGLLMLPTNNKKVSLPKDYVVSSLTKDQEEYILSYGGSIIYFYHDPSCSSCFYLLNKLEEIVSNLAPYVFIVYSPSNQTEIIVKNAAQEQKLNSGSLQDIFTIVCSTIPFNTKQHEICVDYAITSSFQPLNISSS